MESEILERVVSLIRRARSPLLLTGAGISAESGVPIFRGKEGLWQNYRPEELATPEAFKRDPKLVWEWYNWRKELVSKCEPNKGHFAATTISTLLGIPIITQNVDGLHKEAEAKNLIEMHGNLFSARYVDTNEVFDYTDTTKKGKVWKLCLQGRVRPHIVWFGEAIETQKMNAIFDYLNATNLLIVVGSSGIVYPAAGFIVEVLRKKGYVIEINMEANVSTYERHIYLQGKAGEILPLLAKKLQA